MAIKGGEIISHAYQDVQRLQDKPVRVPNLRRPDSSRLPHVPHGKGILAALTLAGVVAGGVVLFSDKGSVKPESNGNIGPGGVILDQDTFPMGKPLAITLDSAGQPDFKLDTDAPDVWSFGPDSPGGLNRQYVPVLGPEYEDGFGKVQITMGEPGNNPDIAFGGVWFERVIVVNGEVLPAGADGQVLSPGESPIYTKASPELITTNPVPQGPVSV